VKRIRGESLIVCDYPIPGLQIIKRPGFISWRNVKEGMAYGKGDYLLTDAVWEDAQMMEDYLNKWFYPRAREWWEDINSFGQRLLWWWYRIKYEVSNL